MTQKPLWVPITDQGLPRMRELKPFWVSAVCSLQPNQVIGHKFTHRHKMFMVRGSGRGPKAREPSRGVRGHDSLEYFRFSYALKCDFLHFEAVSPQNIMIKSNITLVNLQLFSAIADQFPKVAVVALVYL